jgi:ABC-2 type transport system ATP-binding protein
MDALKIDSVTKTYEGHQAVDNLDLTVPRGSIFGLLGPNGAGKTTSIRMVMNIIIPDQGRIAVLGEGMNEALKERIGYLPEERGLYPKMKVCEVLHFLAAIKGVAARTARERTDQWLDRLGLTDWKDKKVEELSKGMQQKVQFISAMVHDPELLILDEPFSGLDPVNVDQLKEIILELHQQGKTIVFSTHIMEQVERLCEYICLINKGRKVLDGRLSDVKHSYGENTIALEFDGKADFLKDKTLIDNVDGYGNYAEVTLAKGVEPQQLLERAVASGIMLKRFQVMEPTLHNIFVNIVGREAA